MANTNLVAEMKGMRYTKSSWYLLNSFFSFSNLNSFKIRNNRKIFTNLIVAPVL